jgi:phosphoribosylformimino-5-aminoimidazole carboxamide ribotide isomerase
VVERANLEFLADYCCEFLVHATEREGKQQGIDTELVRLLGSESPIPTTYAGGIRSMEDIETVRREGGGRLDYTVGSALDIFGGDVKYDDIVALNKS